MFSSCGYVIFALLLAPYTGSARRLNEYIRHYESLSYPTEEVHRNHLIAKRSVTQENIVPVKFHAHGREFDIRLKRDLSTFSHDLVIQGSSGEVLDVETSHIYQGHLQGDDGSLVFGSISDGIFHGKIISPRTGAWYVERAHNYFPHRELNETLHSVIYHENDVVDPYADLREGHKSGCGNVEDVEQWMLGIQDSEESNLSTGPITKGNKKKLRVTKSQNEGDSYEYVHKYTQEMNNSGHQRFRRTTTSSKTCSLYIRTDPTVWRHISEKLHHDAEKTREEILSLLAHHIAAINYIYSHVKFDGRLEHRNIRFEVQMIKIDDMAGCTPRNNGDPNPFCKEDINITDFLDLHSFGNHENFCLAYVFSYRNFTDGTLTLAWQASATGASGGICEKYKTYTAKVDGMYKSTKRSLNTGVITFQNYNTRVPPKVSQLSLAHAIGHNFGSPHDFRPECRPGGPNGNYIMFAKATSGERPNNGKFSICSIANISNVLDEIGENKKKNCFFNSRHVGFCGNKIVEVGEECDCGYDDEDCTDKCCYPRVVSQYDVMKNQTARGCSRRAMTQCSPSQGPCCSSETCQIVSHEARIQCKAESDCTFNSICNGLSAECPAPLMKANKTICNNGTQLCFNGECTESVCQKWNMTQCFLNSDIIPNIDERKLCVLACQNGTDPSSCRSTSEFAQVVGLPDGGISLTPGSPCDNFQGYCNESLKCKAVNH